MKKNVCLLSVLRYNESGLDKLIISKCENLYKRKRLSLCWSGVKAMSRKKAMITMNTSNDLREAIVATDQPRKGYKVISKLLGLHPTVRKIIHKWKTFKTVANLPKSGRPNIFTPRSVQ